MIEYRRSGTLPLLDNDTREIVLRDQYDLPFIKLLSNERAYQSPLILPLEEYNIDQRDKLEKYRDPQQLPMLVEQVIVGVESLHQLGYVHNDLTPDIIVITLRLLKATHLDFDITQLKVAMTSREVKGTPACHPASPILNYGSTAWDTWTITTIILKCDMRPEEYYWGSTDRGGQMKERKKGIVRRRRPALQ